MVSDSIVRKEKSMNLKSSMASAALMFDACAGMTLGGYDEYASSHNNGVRKSPKPWDNIQLSKSERKDKTWEQLQELRKAKWESEQNEL
jgi:hypothetical protein